MTDNNKRVNQRQLDRLAAGDSSGEEARQIFESLDQVPDGWKQCALTLLEAQSWRRTMRGLTEGSDQHVVTALRRDSTKHTGPRSGRLWRFVGTAMLVTIALMGGISLGRHSAQPSPRTEQPFAESKHMNHMNPDGTLAHHRPDTRPEQKRVGLLKVEGKSGTPRFVPVVYDPAASEATFDHEPPLSEYERHLLALSGWEVTQDRKLLTVRLAGGGELTIPIDALHYRAIRPQIY